MNESTVTQGELKRVNITEIPLGRRLTAPIYSRSGRLLLAEDQIFTRNMRTSLQASGTETVYLGQWNPDAVARYESAWTDYRSFGKELLLRLERDVEAEIADLRPNVEPGGVPLHKSLVRHGLRVRTRTEVAQAQRDYESAMADTGAALQGAMAPEHVPAAAERVALTVMKQVKNDLDLLLSIAGLGGGSYFEQHALNTVVLSMSIAAAMDYSEDQVVQLGIGALFKDIGMRHAPAELVQADRRITPVEHLDIQKHTITGLNALQNIRAQPPFVRYLVDQHHERVDGRGYPKARKKAVIHPFSRIVAVADTYDSLTSPRPWRPALHPYRAMETLLRGSETPYDNAVLRGLLHFVSLFPVGSHLRLNTGDIVRVIGANPGHFHHPLVMVLQPEPSSGLERDQIVDLLEQQDYKPTAPWEAPLAPAPDDYSDPLAALV